MDYVEYYFEQAFGCYPHKDDKAKEITQGFINYLMDNSFHKETIDEVIKYGCKHSLPYLSHEVLEGMEYLYENSLMEYGVFYYHPDLQLRSPSPTFNPMTGETKSVPFYLEMKMFFFKEDLVRYAYEKLRMPHELMDLKRDVGAVDFLLKKYEKITEVKPLDFIMFCIDEAKAKGANAFSMLDISAGEQEALAYVKRMVPEKELKKVNQIVWR